MDDNKKIEISRWFSKKLNTGNFENLDVGMSLKVEYDASEFTDEFVRSISEHLDKLVRQEVERTIEKEMEKVEAIKKQNTF
jgi:hypothetical protein